MTISPALFPAVTVTVVRDRKIWTALRTNQIAGFVTVPSWKIIKTRYLRENRYDNTQPKYGLHVNPRLKAYVFDIRYPYDV